jgi:predicted GIY-YIG superfamily endonuclease
LVYRIQCSCNTHYTGIVHRQHLTTRLKQHNNNCKRIINLAKKSGITNTNNIKLDALKRISDQKRQKEENPMLNIDPELLKLTKVCETSGLTTHFSETGHLFDTENAKIVDISNNKLRLGILEMIHIKLDPGINKMTDTQNLHPSYFGLIEKNKYEKSKNKHQPVNNNEPVTTKGKAYNTLTTRDHFPPN